MKLSDDTARKITLDPGQTDKIVFDDEIPGFGVRVRAGGRRTWIAQYRIGRTQSRMTIGKTLALPEAKARKQAKEIFAKVELGDDPQADGGPPHRAEPACEGGSSHNDDGDHIEEDVRVDVCLGRVQL